MKGSIGAGGTVGGLNLHPDREITDADRDRVRVLVAAHAFNETDRAMLLDALGLDEDSA